MRQVPQDTHIPEFAVAAVAAAALPSPLRGGSTAVAQRRRSGWGSELVVVTASNSLDSPAPTRPIRLFARPEPVDAIAEVPDGPPAQFTWRHAVHVVARAEGPERIAMEWWRDEAGRALTRDYFRVESHDGVRVWLYREGLFNGGHPTRWFLHGVFA